MVDLPEGAEGAEEVEAGSVPQHCKPSSFELNYLVYIPNFRLLSTITKK